MIPSLEEHTKRGKFPEAFSIDETLYILPAVFSEYLLLVLSGVRVTNEDAIQGNLNNWHNANDNYNLHEKLVTNWRSFCDFYYRVSAESSTHCTSFVESVSIIVYGACMFSRNKGLEEIKPLDIWNDISVMPVLALQQVLLCFFLVLVVEDTMREQLKDVSFDRVLRNAIRIVNPLAIPENPSDLLMYDVYETMNELKIVIERKFSTMASHATRTTKLPSASLEQNMPWLSNDVYRKLVVTPGEKNHNVIDVANKLQNIEMNVTKLFPESFDGSWKVTTEIVSNALLKQHEATDQGVKRKS